MYEYTAARLARRMYEVIAARDVRHEILLGSVRRRY